MRESIGANGEHLWSQQDLETNRVFNNRANANHRNTTDRAARDLMVSRGGTAEGYGEDVAIMCAPPGGAAAQ